jgi:membrane associated rhomboid family serine protease
MYFFAFYPVGFDPPVRRQPALTYGLIALMGGLFIWLHYAPSTLPIPVAKLVFFPGNRAPWSLVTAVFLHGSWLHYLGNMIYLWVFGPPLEERLGRVRFLLVFLLIGTSGNLFHGAAAVSGWLGANGLGVLGASGAIAGLLALVLLRCPFGRVVVAYWVLAALQGQNRAGRVRLGLPAAIAGWLLLQVVHALVASETGDAVSYAAHLGGFLCGIGCAAGFGLISAGRAEVHLVRGRRYIERGEAMAAVGEYRTYLEQWPDSRGGRIELARALRMAGHAALADEAYRDLFERDVAAGRIDRAVAVHEEARRGRAAATLDPDLLAQVARFQERQLDFAAALRNYQDLVEYFPTHPRRDYALVRIVSLLRGPLGRRDAARRWLRRALAVLPPGAWRDYLRSEEPRFRTEPHAEPEPPRYRPRPEPAA